MSALQLDQYDEAGRLVRFTPRGQRIDTNPATNGFGWHCDTCPKCGISEAAGTFSYGFSENGKPSDPAAIEPAIPPGWMECSSCGHQFNPDEHPHTTMLSDDEIEALPFDDGEE